MQQEKENLQKLETSLYTEKDKLQKAQKEFEEKQKLLNQRNNMWWIFTGLTQLA